MTFKEDYLELKFDDCTALLKKLPNSSETVGCNCIIFYGCLYDDFSISCVFYSFFSF